MRNTKAIIKVSSTCNLACSYCNYPLCDREGGHGSIMDREVLRKSVSQLMALCPDEVEFIWHGGEPLLAGKGLLSEALFLQRQLRRKRQRIVNRLQTNGTLLDRSWVNFLKQNRFHLGISLDGPQRLHDHYRAYPSGEGSFADVVRAVELLKGMELSFGVLAVVSKDTVGEAKEIYDFFLGSGTRRLDFLPCAEIDHARGGMTAPSVTPSQFADFMIELFDLWLQDDNPGVSIRYFDSILMAALGGKPRLCEFAGTCKDFITIDTNGDIYPCDILTGDEGLKFGNVLEADLEDILETKEHKAFAEQVSERKPECSRCEWYYICRGGCSHYRYVFDQNLFDKNYFCGARKRIFKHIVETAELILCKPNASIEGRRSQVVLRGLL